MTTKSKHVRYSTTVDVSGKEVDRQGLEAYIFVNIGGWDTCHVLSTFPKPNENISRWFYEISRRVWASFTAAGDPIKKATFVVRYNEEYWQLFNEGWKAPGDVIVTDDDPRTAEDWAERYLPTKRPIIIAIVRDDEDYPEHQYYSSLEKQTNIIASHHLVYNRPVSFCGCKDADQADEKDHEEIYTNDPRGYYHKYDQTRERLSQDE